MTKKIIIDGIDCSPLPEGISFEDFEKNIRTLSSMLQCSIEKISQCRKAGAITYDEYAMLISMERK